MYLAVTYGGESLYQRIFLLLGLPKSCLSCMDLNQAHIEVIAR